MFQFRKKADKLIILGEPVGDVTALIPAIRDFIRAADAQDLSLVFYEISETLTMQLHEYGFDFMKFGEEGYVDVQNFSLAGTKRKGERALIHKFEREGYTYSWLKPPLTEQTLRELRMVSDDWLAGRQEDGFSLGYFDDHYLNQAPVAVMRNHNGTIVSFASAMPTGTATTTSIDLMRSSTDAPSGIMDGMFVNLFQQAKADGFATFNMGMAPLANVGRSDYAFLEEKNGPPGVSIRLPLLRISGVAIVQGKIRDALVAEIRGLPQAQFAVIHVVADLVGGQPTATQRSSCFSPKTAGGVIEAWVLARRYR